MLYTMKLACEKTGLSYETLKFYCNQGLIPDVKRDEQNRRVFTDDNIAWINSLTCLKNCGMGIQEMKEYLQLCMQGNETIPERKVILNAKKAELQKELKRVQDSIAYIDWKQGFYDDLLSGKTDMQSYIASQRES